MKNSIFSLLFIVLFSANFGQNIPIRINHSVYNFLERHESLGHIKEGYWSTKPYTFNQVQSMLHEIEGVDSLLSETEK